MASIQKRGNNFLVSVSMKFDDDGKQIRKTTTFTPDSSLTSAQAKSAAKDFAREYEKSVKGLPNYNDNMTVNELYNWYMKTIAPNKKRVSTLDTNAVHYEKYLAPHIGKHKLRDITAPILDDVFKRLKEKGALKEYFTLDCVEKLKDALHAVGGSYRKMAIAGIISVDRMTIISRGGHCRKDTAQKIADFVQKPLDDLFTPVDGKALSDSTLKAIQVTLSSLLTTAKKKGIITISPMENAEIISISEKSRAVLDNEQAKLFLMRLGKNENISVRAALVTALYTGMRSGELRALLWSDIDLQRGFIHVKETVDNKQRNGKPKTKESRRIIKVENRLASFLAEYKVQLDEYISSARGFVNNGIVFPAITTGRYMNSNVLNDTIKRLIAGTIIPQNLHCHSLRHSFASLTIDGGASVKDVQAALGHSRSVTTLDIYVHSFETAQARLMQGVSLALSDNDSIFGIAE
jgi:integrase